MSRDEATQHDMGPCEPMRGVVVRHELAEKPPRPKQREEGQRADALRQDHRSEAPQTLIRSRVMDENRFGLGCVSGPGAVSFRRVAILIRQPAPRLEADHPIRVEEQNRGTRGPERRRNRVQRRGIDLLECFGSRGRRRETIERFEARPHGG